MDTGSGIGARVRTQAGRKRGREYGDERASSDLESGAGSDLIPGSLVEKFCVLFSERRCG